MIRSTQQPAQPRESSRSTSALSVESARPEGSGRASMPRSGRDARPESPGLSKGHKCTASRRSPTHGWDGARVDWMPRHNTSGPRGRLVVHSTGSLVTVRTDAGSALQPPPHRSPGRGRIKEWSRKSRQQLKIGLAQLDRAALESTLFVTLTYPGEFPAPDDHEVYKNHLRVFLQRLVRERGRGLAGFWKLEFQKRGAAHYHILVTGFQGDLVEFRKWLARTWFEVVGSGNPDHLRAGTGAELSRSVQGAMSYLAKYIAKNDQTRPGNFTGRYWGKFNRESLPISPVEVIDLNTEKEVATVKRWARKIISNHVMETRWKIALSDSKGWMDPGKGWTRLTAEAALTGVKVMTTMKRERKDLGLPEGGQLWTQVTGPGTMKIPRKFKLGAQATIRLIVPAARFAADVLRARELGVFERQPSRKVHRISRRASPASWRLS